MGYQRSNWWGAWAISFLVTKAVLIGIGVPFPQSLDGLQSRNNLPSPVPSVASLQVSRAVMSHLTLLFLCVLLPACVLTGRLPGLDTSGWKVLPAETVCSLPCFLSPQILSSAAPGTAGLDH